jgi:flagellar hook-associated protein 2
METAFGKGKISVTLKQSTDGNDQTLCFDAADGKSTLTINASDILVRGNIGIKENESNRLTLRNSIWDNREKLGLLSYHTEEEMNQALANFSINGKVIKGLTADTSISDMLSKINNSDAGVKASYLSDSGRFILISDETGSGRQINIHGDGFQHDCQSDFWRRSKYRRSGRRDGIYLWGYCPGKL